jgi:hypothetical protein
MGWLKALLSILSNVFQNMRDSGLKADGARKAELERRDEFDRIKKESEERRKKTADSSDDDILGGL